MNINTSFFVCFCIHIYKSNENRLFPKDHSLFSLTHWKNLIHLFVFQCIFILPFIFPFYISFLYFFLFALPDIPFSIRLSSVAHTVRCHYPQRCSCRCKQTGPDLAAERSLLPRCLRQGTYHSQEIPEYRLLREAFWSPVPLIYGM